MEISESAVADLRSKLKGSIVRPSDAGYDEARSIWNAMIDKRPALIVKCASTTDVVHAVNFARENRLPLSVRGGGHNIAGTALCDGVVIDFSSMRKVSVNEKNQTAIVEAGATLGDVDKATQAHGLATPFGINSTTGIAGLTLGGGFGWLSRKHGMTVDNLISAEVVLASGEVLSVGKIDHPDLYWAIRGGSGNFGVVTRFEYQLHPVGPNVFTGMMVFPLSEARSVLQKYADFMDTAPNDLTIWTVLRKAPPLPFLPEEQHGKEILALPFVYFGDPENGEALISPLRNFGTVVGEFTAVQPYTAWQQTFDPLLAPGARNYWKSHNFSQIGAPLFEEVVKAIETLPSDECEIFFGGIGGETMNHAPEETAYPHRDARYAMNVHGRWSNAADDEKCITWAKNFYEASKPFASGGVYVNFLTSDERGRVQSAYGVNYERLRALKHQYDPDNLFSSNQNIW